MAIVPSSLTRQLLADRAGPVISDHILFISTTRILLSASSGREALMKLEMLSSILFFR